MTAGSQRPPGLTPLGRLCQYANFQRIGDEPPTVVTMDHRMVVPIAWAAQRQGLFGNQAPILVRLDAHPDVGERPRPWPWEKTQLTNLDSVISLLNQHRLDDGGWVISALQFGLASQVLTFFVHDYHRFEGDTGPYRTFDGVERQLATYKSIDEFLTSKTPAAFDSVKDAGTVQDFQPSSPIWVDIDLDFATERSEDDSPRVWTDEEWCANFGPASCDFLGRLIEHAALVTVATEPEFCGGHIGVGKIVTGLRSRNKALAMFFKNL